MAFIDSFDLLIEGLSGLPGVRAIGESGGARMPESGESDIDLFVFCDEVPPIDDRRRFWAGMRDVMGMDLSKSPGKFWGTCDFVDIAGGDVCMMYFTESAMNAELEAVLCGELVAMVAPAIST